MSVYRSIPAISIAFFLIGILSSPPWSPIFLGGNIGILLYFAHRSYERGKEELRQEFISYVPPVLVAQKYSVAEFGMEISKNWEELARMQSVLESIREGVLAVDDEGRILLYNHSAEKLLDTSLYGNRISDIPLPKQISKLLTKDKEGAEWLWKRGKKPNRHYVHCAGVQWEYGSLIVLRDVTKIKRLERVRQDFFANVSHELKTPMAIIQAHAEALAGGAYKEEDVAISFLNTLLRNSERLNYIVTTMLDLANLEAGTYEMLLTREDILPLVEQSMELFENSITKKNLHLILKQTHSCYAYIDADAFMHIINNFLENAIKYTPQNGLIEISIQDTQKGIEVSVSDNGPGIELKYQKRVFERFFRIDKGRAREEGGSGLGLSIVRNLADAMDAQVGVRSSVLGGAEFWGIFPKTSQ